MPRPLLLSLCADIAKTIRLTWFSLKENALLDVAITSDADREENRLLAGETLDLMSSFAPPSIGALKWFIRNSSKTIKVTTLDLSQLGSEFSDSNAKELLKHFPNLTSLNLANTAIANVNLAAIGKNLTMLDVSNCRSIDNKALIKLIGQNPKLQILNLASTAITAKDLTAVAETNHSLIELDISDCLNVGDGVIAIARNNSELQVLNCRVSKSYVIRSVITSNELEEIAKHTTKLTKFDITGNTKVEQGIEAIARANLRLQILNCGNTLIHQATMQMIGETITTLTELDVTNCWHDVLAQDIVAIARNNPGLRKLNFSCDYSAARNASTYIGELAKQITTLTECSIETHDYYPDSSELTRGALSLIYSNPSLQKLHFKNARIAADMLLQGLDATGTRLNELSVYCDSPDLNEFHAVAAMSAANPTIKILVELPNNAFTQISSEDKKLLAKTLELMAQGHSDNIIQSKRLFLERDKNPRERGLNNIYWAVRTQDRETLHTLVTEKGENINAASMVIYHNGRVQKSNITPLHQALLYNKAHHTLVNELLQLGANPNATMRVIEDDGKIRTFTLLDQIAETPETFDASTIISLLQAGAKLSSGMTIITKPKDTITENVTLLHHIISGYDSKRITPKLVDSLRPLLQLGENPNAVVTITQPNKDKWENVTLMHELLIGFGYPKIPHLLSLGANINAVMSIRKPDGTVIENITPLHHLVCDAPTIRERVVDLLVKKGAHRNAGMSITYPNKEKWENLTPLHALITKKRNKPAEIIHRIMPQSPTNMKIIKPDGTVWENVTPLHLAIALGFHEAIEPLILQGEDLAARMRITNPDGSRENFRVREWAEKYNNQSVMQKLEEATNTIKTAILSKFPDRDIQDMDLSVLGPVNNNHLSVVVDHFHNLRSLNLSGITAITETGISAIISFNHHTLQHIDLTGCSQISNNFIQKLKTGLPNTNITPPEGEQTAAPSPSAAVRDVARPERMSHSKKSQNKGG